MVPCLEVYDSSTGEDILVGEAHFSLRRGTISTTFAYDSDYLASEQAYAIDPMLPLDRGATHVANLPGVFRDSAPDRWGRHLMERAQRFSAEKTERATRRLDEVDFLTGVLDLTREGSLRFKQKGEGFLSAGSPIPAMMQLPELADAARKAAEDTAGRAQIKELLDAGSGSLGGARPKASVIDDGKLLLAKFSHPGDEWDVMAWEKTALDLAEMAAIPVPSSSLLRIGGESVLLLERFDRQDSQLEGRRIPYMSAMTALESSDGQARDYAELAEATMLLCDDAASQARELFRRVVFSVAINNTDDHLRNWGFLRHGKSWTLCPLFDVNPNPYAQARRVTSVAGKIGEDAAHALPDLAIYMGVSPEEASITIEQVSMAVSQWKSIARKNGISQSELTLFEPAFKRVG